MFLTPRNIEVKEEEEIYNGTEYKVITLSGQVNESMFRTFVQQYKNCLDDNVIVTITSTGGAITWAYMIGRILMNHEKHAIARVPEFALSSGTIIALACTSIHLSTVGCLGPIDPYIYGINVPECHNILKTTDDSWSNWAFGWSWLGIISKYGSTMLGKVRDDHHQVILKLLERCDNAEKIYDFFTHTKHHCTPIYYSDIPKTLGLDILMDKDMFKHPDERKALKVHKVGEKNPLYKKMLHASTTGTPLDITDEPLADDTSSCSSLINGADN